MIIFDPLTVTDSNLTSSNIPEPDAGETIWVSGASVSIGDERIRTQTHKVYRSLTGTNTTTPPEDDPTNWQELRPTNRYAMFDERNGTSSTETSSIVVTIDAGKIINGLAGFNVTADAINVTVTDPIEGVVYNNDLPMRDSSLVVDYYTWCYTPIVFIDRFVLLDLPPYPNATITITFTSASGDVSVGNLCLGFQNSIGKTLMGTGLSGQDFSSVNRDEFGNYNIVERAQSDDVDFDIVIPRNQTNYFRSILRSVRNRTTVFLGQTGETNDPTLVYGFYVDYAITMQTKTLSFSTLSVEGVI